MTEPRSHPQPFDAPPAGACNVVLVRHGQSEPFVEGTPFPLVDGHGDPALSPLGEWQADRLGERLSDHPLTAIYVSSLRRTHQTAAPLAQHLGIEPVVDADLREIFLGDFEGGLFRQRSAEDHPAVLRFRENLEWGEIPGAETNEQLRQRTVGAIERIAAAHPDQMVAVVCHGGVIAALIAHAVGTHPFTFRGVRNASITHLFVEPDRWDLRAFNDAAHVGPLHLNAYHGSP